VCAGKEDAREFGPDQGGKIALYRTACRSVVRQDPSCGLAGDALAHEEGGSLARRGAGSPAPSSPGGKDPTLTASVQGEVSVEAAGTGDDALGVLDAATGESKYIQAIPPGRELAACRERRSLSKEVEQAPGPSSAAKQVLGG
jgi:hypothetical protein